MTYYEPEELELALDLCKRLERLPKDSILNSGRGMEVRFYFDGEPSGLAVKRDSMGDFKVWIGAQAE